MVHSRGTGEMSIYYLQGVWGGVVSASVLTLVEERPSDGSSIV